MNDRDLIILAAKTAGLKGKMSGDFRVDLPGGGFKYWNPLRDDGDAFRLMVKLDLDVFCGNGWLNDTVGPTVMHRSTERFEESAEDNGDANAAARRAIVRAAAALGGFDTYAYNESEDKVDVD